MYDSEIGGSRPPDHCSSGQAQDRHGPKYTLEVLSIDLFLLLIWTSWT